MLQGVQPGFGCVAGGVGSPDTPRVGEKNGARENPSRDRELSAWGILHRREATDRASIHPVVAIDGPRTAYPGLMSASFFPVHVTGLQQHLNNVAKRHLPMFVGSGERESALTL